MDVDDVPLNKALDPANAIDPSALSKELLRLIPGESPSLPLVVRWALYVQPEAEDCNSPDFPYSYADLEDITLTPDLRLDTILVKLDKPVSEDVSPGLVQRFCEAVAEALNNDEDKQLKYLTKLMAYIAPQDCMFAKTFFVRFCPRLHILAFIQDFCLGIREL